MSSHDIRLADRPKPDKVITQIADYVCKEHKFGKEALETATQILGTNQVWLGAFRTRLN